MRGFNGGIIGKSNKPTVEIAGGIWSLTAQTLAQRDKLWPDIFSPTTLRLDFDETTTLDSRITFTRATSGTYFDSSGVLQTATSGAARFDHRLENGVWINKGLLIEEQRTNVNQRSEELDNVWYVKSGATITTNTTTAPDGTTTADTFTPTNGSTNYAADPQGAGNFSAATQNQNWSGSFFVKNNNLGRVGADLNFRTSAGASSAAVGVNIDFSTSPPSLSAIESGAVLVSSNTQDVGNGWWRITFTGYSTNSTTARVSMRIRQPVSDIVTGDGSKGVYLWGLQLEAGAFATSYIKTTSASVTRNADVAVMTGTDFSDWYNQTEGTVFWQGDFTGVTTASSRCFTFSNNTSNERIICIARSDFFRATGIDGGVNQFEIDASGVVTGQTYEAALALKLNDIAFAVDGSLIGTDTSATLPTPDRVYLGSTFNGGAGFFNGHAAKFYYWNTRRPNSFLQEITS